MRYEKRQINEVQIWVGYNTLKGYKNKEIFKKQSFSNYEWSIIDLKNPRNSILLYGQDIRDLLPEISTLNLDYDDILSRSLYHIDKSLKNAVVFKDLEESMNQFTKAVFKFGFYLCIYFDSDFNLTSIRKIAKNIQKLSDDKKIDEMILKFIKQSITFRRKNQFDTEYKKLRNEFILYVFSLIGKGKIHREMKYKDLIYFLQTTFDGLPFLIQMAKKIRNVYYYKKTFKK